MPRYRGVRARRRPAVDDHLPRFCMVRRCGGSTPQAYRSELHALPAAESPVLLDARRVIPAAGGPDPGGHPALCLTSGAEHPVRTGGRGVYYSVPVVIDWPGTVIAINVPPARGGGSRSKCHDRGRHPCRLASCHRRFEGQPCFSAARRPSAPTSRVPNSRVRCRSASRHGPSST
jgi:hypothetical protein